MTTSVVKNPVRRIMVATDRSATAERAVRWAADMANGLEAELVLLQVLIVPPSGNGAAPPAPSDAAGAPPGDAAAQATMELRKAAEQLAGKRGKAVVVVDTDPTQAILNAIETEKVDTIVVGNVGMAGRKQFLLGNIPNQISHNARCTVIIVNTAPGAAPPMPAKAAGPKSDSAQVEGKLLARALRIARVMAKAGLREFRKKAPLGDMSAARERGKALRTALDQLGPTFAKLGQILSTRPDLLPREMIEELETLQERVTPLTEAEVVAAMERELRVPWEDVFKSIDPKPLAAGTIAQVHRATLENGERVVVKVQRPTAERDILQDLALLEMFAERAAKRPVFRSVFDLPAIIRHLSESLRRELDFRREASNIKRMREVVAPFNRLAVPGVYEQYSTSRLLVMEEVQGVKVREAPPGPVSKEAAKQLVESFYRQVFVEGFFHADPHPGNLKWWNDKIYFLDLGMVGEVEPEVREMLLMLLLAFSQQDVSFLAEMVLNLSGQGQQVELANVEAFKEDLARFVEQRQGQSLKELQLGAMLQEITEISVRHNVRVPASLALAGKAFAQMQNTAAELDPDLDPLAVASSFVLKNTLKQMSGVLDPKKLFYELQKGGARINRFVGAIERLTGASPGARLEVNFRGTERLEQTIDRGIRWLSLALIATGTAVAVAATAASERLSWGVPATIGGAGLAACALVLLSIMRH